MQGFPTRFISGHNSRRLFGDDAYRIDPETGCWIWQGDLTNYGYGRVMLNKKPRLAHGAMYEVLRGPVPVGMELHHTCREKRCVNPDHLDVITKSAHASLHQAERKRANGRVA